MTLLAADGEGSWYFAIFLGLSFLICEWRGVNQLSSKTHCSAILSFFFFLKLLEYSCFTMLHQSQVHSELVNQLCIYHFSLDSFPIQAIIEYRVEFPVVYNRPLLIIYFLYSSVYMSIPVSQFIPSPFPSSTHQFVLSIFSISILQRRSFVPFFRFHLKVISYNICLSLSHFIQYSVICDRL